MKTCELCTHIMKPAKAQAISTSTWLSIRNSSGFWLIQTAGPNKNAIASTSCVSTYIQAAFTCRCRTKNILLTTISVHPQVFFCLQHKQVSYTAAAKETKPQNTPEQNTKPHHRTKTNCLSSAGCDC